MNGEYAIAPQGSRLFRPGAGACALLALLVIISALFIPPLWLLSGIALILVLVVVRGTPSQVLVRFSRADPIGLSPRSPPLPV